MFYGAAMEGATFSLLAGITLVNVSSIVWTTIHRQHEAWSGARRSAFFPGVVLEVATLSLLTADRYLLMLLPFVPSTCRHWLGRILHSWRVRSYLDPPYRLYSFQFPVVHHQTSEIASCLGSQDLQ